MYMYIYLAGCGSVCEPVPDRASCEDANLSCDRRPERQGQRMAVVLRVTSYTSSLRPHTLVA